VGYGFRLWGLGCGVWGVGFRFECVMSHIPDSREGVKVCCESRMWDLGFRLQFHNPVT